MGYEGPKGIRANALFFFLIFFGGLLRPFLGIKSKWRLRRLMHVPSAQRVLRAFVDRPQSWSTSARPLEGWVAGSESVCLDQPIPQSREELLARVIPRLAQMDVRIDFDQPGGVSTASATLLHRHHRSEIKIGTFSLNTRSEGLVLSIKVMQMKPLERRFT